MINNVWAIHLTLKLLSGGLKMHKKARFVLIVMVLSVLMTTTAIAGYEYDATDYSGYMDVVAINEELPAPVFTILHTNDVHGRFLPTNAAIGIDRIATINAQIPNSLLVDAGDTFHGLPFATLNRGLDIVNLMNAAGYVFMAPGNHDFNFGTDRLLELSEAAEFTLLAANTTRDGELLFDDVAIAEVNGLTIGFFGLVHPGTYYLTNPANIVGVSFGDPIVAAQESVALLQELGVDLIVALSHLGSGARSDYRVDGWGIAVAEAVDGIDILVDGHSHNLHENGITVNGTLVVQAGDHGRFVGRVDVFEVDGAFEFFASYINHEYAVANFESDAYVLALIEEIQDAQAEIKDIVVAYLPETLYVDVIRSQEMPLGNLIADAVLWYTSADVAFTNGGGIRDVLHAGEVTKGDIISVLPFGNYVVTLEVTPALLASAMENAVSALPGGGRFPQVAGFAFTFDPNAEEGARVLSITVEGEYLDLQDDETTFVLATNNFIANGGDAFTMFVGMEALLEFSALDEILIAYVNYADLEGLAVEGRIVENASEVVEVYEQEEAAQYEESDVSYEEAVAEEYEEEYVAYEPVEEVTVVEVPQGVTTAVVVNCWYLNVRAGGGISHNIVNILRAGDVVVVLETTPLGWYRVEMGEVTGWVFGRRYLEVQ